MRVLNVIRAAHLGMCFGVRDAIALALEHADAGPLTILGDLVHNPTVLNALEAKGVAVAQDVAQVTTPTVMVTAHGTSERTLARTRELVKTCARYCARVHHVQTDADVRPEWFDAAEIVGLTAGTSTPDDVIDRVEERIRTLGRKRELDALNAVECGR